MKNLNWTPDNGKNPEQYLQDASRVSQDIKIPYPDPKSKPARELRVEMQAIFHESETALRDPENLPLTDSSSKPMQIQVRILDLDRRDENNVAPVVAEAITRKHIPGMNWVWPVSIEEQNLFRDNGLNKYVTSSQKPEYGVTFDHEVPRDKSVVPTITITTRLTSSEKFDTRSAKFSLTADEEDPKLEVVIRRYPKRDIELKERANMNHIIQSMGPDRGPELPLDHAKVKARLEELFPEVVIQKHPDQILLKTLKDILLRQREIDRSLAAPEAPAQQYFTYENSLNNPDNMRNIAVIRSARSSLKQGMESILRNVSGLVGTHELDLDAALQNVTLQEGETLTAETPDAEKIAMLTRDIASKVVRRIELSTGPRQLRAARSEFFSRNVNNTGKTLHPRFAAWQIRTPHIGSADMRSAEDQGKHYVENIQDGSFAASNFGGRILHAQRALGSSQEKARQERQEFPAPIEVDQRGINHYVEERFVTGLTAMTTWNGLSTEDSIVISDLFAENNPVLITKTKRKQIYDLETGQKKMNPASLENSHETRLHLQYYLGKSHADVKHVLNLKSRYRNRAEKDLLKRIRSYLEHEYPAGEDGKPHELVQQIRNLSNRKDIHSPGQTTPAILRTIAKYHGARDHRIEQYKQLDEHGLRRIHADPEKNRVYPGDVLYAGYFMVPVDKANWLYDPERPEQDQGMPHFEQITVGKNIPDNGALLKEITRADPDQGKTYHHIHLEMEKILKDGDKMVPLDGSKGIVRVIPQDQMPVSAVTDEPMDVIVNSLSPIARTSTTMMNEINWGNAAMASTYALVAAANALANDQDPEVEDEPLTEEEIAGHRATVEQGIKFLPWVLPGSQTNNWKLLHAGSNETPELPENWLDFTREEDIQVLETYLLNHEAALDISALDPEKHAEAVQDFFGRLDFYPNLRVPEGIHGQQKEAMENAINLLDEDGKRLDFSAGHMHIKDSQGNFVTQEGSDEPMAIQAVMGSVPFVVAPQKADEKLNIRRLTSNTRELDRDYDPITHLAISRDGSTPSRIGIHELECAKICGVGAEMAEATHHLRQRDKSQRILAEFLAEPEEGFELQQSTRKAEVILEKLHDTGNEENIEEQYFRDICFAAGFDWNPDTGIMSPLSSREIRERSMKQINNAADLRHGRDSDEQWGHVDFPAVILHPEARKSDRNLKVPLLAAVLGMKRGDFYELIRNPAVPDEERGEIPGTLRLMEMLEQFQAQALAQIGEDALDFNNPKIIRNVISGYQIRMDQAREAEKTDRANRIEIQIQALNLWVDRLEKNPKFDPMNYFLDSFPILPNRLLQNFRQKHSQEAYYGNIEQSYQKILRRIENLRNNGTAQSLRDLDRSFTEILGGRRYDKRSRNTETLNRKNVKGLMERVVNKGSATYDILAGGKVASSGRGVIVPDDDLLATEIRFPWLLATELCKEKLVHMLAERNPEVNAKDLDKIIEQGKPQAVEIVEQIFATRPTLAGRQPTLHSQNAQSFQVQLWKQDDGSVDVENKSIGWSPMNCPATNADFDGDTVWINWIPVRRLSQAIHEAMNPYSKVNLRVARNLGPAITFGHECLDGLCRTPTLQIRKILTDHGISCKALQDKERHSYAEIDELMHELVLQAQKQEITPEQIAKIHRDLMQQGFHTSTWDPVAMGTDTAFRQIQRHLDTHYQRILDGTFKAPAEPEKTLLGAKLMKQSREDLNFRLPGSNPHSMRRKNAAIQWGHLHEEMKRFVNQDLMRELVIDNAPQETLHLIESCRNRARIKAVNLLKICFAVGLPLDKGGVPQDRIITSPFLDGLSPEDMSRVRKAAAEGNIESKDSVALGGYMLNSLRQGFGHWKIAEKDCGTQNSSMLTSPSSDFKIAEGATLAREVPEIPELQVGEMIEPKHIQKLLDSQVREIQIRSLDQCEATENVPTNLEDLQAGDILGGKVLGLESGHILTQEDVSRIQQTDAFQVRETSFQSREKGSPLEQKEESKVVGIREILENPAKSYVLEQDSGTLTAGTKITPENILQMEIPELQGIPVRTRKAGLTCQCCVGSTGTDPQGNLVPVPEIGFHIGSFAATAVTEPITQSLLRHFHAGGTWNEMNDFGLDPKRTIQAGLYDTALGQDLAHDVGEFRAGTELDVETLHKVIKIQKVFEVKDPENQGTNNCKTDGNRMLEYIQDDDNTEGKVSLKLAMSMGNSCQFANRAGVFRFFEQVTETSRSMMNQSALNQTDKASSGKNESAQPAPTLLEKKLTEYDRRDLSQKLREYMAIYDRKQQRLQKRIAREAESEAKPSISAPSKVTQTVPSR